MSIFVFESCQDLNKYTQCGYLLLYGGLKSLTLSISKDVKPKKKKKKNQTKEKIRKTKEKIFDLFFFFERKDF